MFGPQIQHECRYLLENSYQCRSSEFSYLKHVVCSETVNSELCSSSCTCTSSSLKSPFLFDVPHLGLICCIHPSSSVHGMCAALLAPTLKVPKPLSESKSPQNCATERHVLTLACSQLEAFVAPHPGI